MRGLAGGGGVDEVPGRINYYNWWIQPERYCWFDIKVGADRMILLISCWVLWHV